ncbi:MAG: DUF2326 domain-containing protein [Myxococcales bacterium]|nr:DUF2326 domain-containing protein [Myxococcales bacterium]
MRSTLGVEQTLLYQRAQRDHEARQSVRFEAISRFNAHSEALYEAPGRLHIDLDSRTGYRFGVEIDGGGSEGIERMKVFCYDLMLAELWSRRRRGRRGSSCMTARCSAASTSAAGQGARTRRGLLGGVRVSVHRAAQLRSGPGAHLLARLLARASVRLRLTDDRPEGSLSASGCRRVSRR